MLVLSITTGLRLILPNGEVIRIVNTEPQRRARLGIEAPKTVQIVRDGVKTKESGQDAR